MFAIFGLGWGELVVLGIIGIIMIGVPIIAITVALAASRQSKSAAPAHTIFSSIKRTGQLSGR